LLCYEASAMRGAPCAATTSRNARPRRGQSPLRDFDEVGREAWRLLCYEASAMRGAPCAATTSRNACTTSGSN
jgi:hypothetical protein